MQWPRNLDMKECDENSYDVRCYMAYWCTSDNAIDLSIQQTTREQYASFDHYYDKSIMKWLLTLPFHTCSLTDWQSFFSRRPLSDWSRNRPSHVLSFLLPFLVRHRVTCSVPFTPLHSHLLLEWLHPNVMDRFHIIALFAASSFLSHPLRFSLSYSMNCFSELGRDRASLETIQFHLLFPSLDISFTLFLVLQSWLAGRKEEESETKDHDGDDGYRDSSVYTCFSITHFSSFFLFRFSFIPSFCFHCCFCCLVGIFIWQKIFMTGRVGRNACWVEGVLYGSLWWQQGWQNRNQRVGTTTSPGGIVPSSLPIW